MQIDSVFFTSALRLEVSEGDGEWVLLAPFTADVHFANGRQEPIHVPEGFITDLASVPRFPGMFLFFGGKARKSAVLHDYLYSVQADREFADAVFYAAMRNEEPAWRRGLMWLGVRLGGWPYYLTDKAADLQ
jgi:hypothetical protein